MENRQGFDLSLRDLRTKLLQMGEAVRGAMKEALVAYHEGDIDAAIAIRDNDVHVNRLEHAVEDLCIRLIATQQPVASDLRKIVAGMRIAADLERIGDFAVDVAKTTIRLKGTILTKFTDEIDSMAKLVDNMIADALQAYVENDAMLAQRLAEEDDQVDRTYRHIVEGLFATGHSAEFASEAVYIAFVGRYFERCGDHATNIGESVIYIASGERSDLN